MNKKTWLINFMLVATALSSAIGETNQVAAVQKRNALALQTTSAVTNVVIPQTPPPKIKLNGIAILPPDKWALLEIQAEGQPVDRVAMTEGSRKASLELVTIDAKGKSATIRNAGVLTTLAIGKSESPSMMAANFGGEHVPLPLLPVVGAGDP
ncbi:MAG: hypothetical protein WDM80_06570 [Limisphaerales bacterium]